MKIGIEKFGIKIFLAYTLTIFLISLSFMAFYIHHGSELLTRALMKEGRLLTGILAFNSRIGVFSENHELLKDPVEAIFQNEGVLEICVFNLKGQLLEHRRRPGLIDSRTPIDDPDLFEKLASSKSIFHRKHNGTFEFWSAVISTASYAVNGSVFYEDNSVQVNDRPIGFVKVRFDCRQLNQEIRELLVKSILIMVAFLIIGSGFSYLAAHRISKPLNRLTEGVNAFGRGRMVNKVSVETGDEIGKLAEAFNEMYDSLVKREKEIRDSEDRLRSLSSQLFDAQEKERKRISRVLHDEIGQALALLKHRVRSIERNLPLDQASLSEKCKNISKDIDQIIENIRRLSRDLRPSILEDLGLSAALRETIANLKNQHSLEVSIQMDNIDGLLRQETQSNLYRLFQEVLTNIGKHARASHVRVEIKKEDRALSFLIEDNGIGFDVNEAMAGALASRGVGLTAVQERAHMLGASLNIESQAGDGTIISLKIPLN